MTNLIHEVSSLQMNEECSFENVVMTNLFVVSCELLRLCHPRIYLLNSYAIKTFRWKPTMHRL